jgi:hypothetical protein
MEKKMTFTTTQEILRALADGKKVRRMAWHPREYIRMSDKGIVDEADNLYSSTFDCPANWEIYSEHKPKVKWYRAVMKSAYQGRPAVSQYYYKSDDDAKSDLGKAFLTLLPDPIELEAE